MNPATAALTYQRLTRTQGLCTERLTASSTSCLNADAHAACEKLASPPQCRLRCRSLSVDCTLIAARTSRLFQDTQTSSLVSGNLGENQAWTIWFNIAAPLWEEMDPEATGPMLTLGG